MSGSGDLEQSLRADIEGYINGRLGGLQEEIARLQSQLNEAFTRLSERLTSESESDASVAVTIAEHLRTARNTGIEAAAIESSRARSSSDIALIKAAIDELDSQRTQSDILNALVNRAAGFAPRVAFFVIRNDRATGWRARGLEGTVGDNSVREISLPLTSDTLLSEVVRTRSTWSGSPGSRAEDREIFGKFGDEPPQRIIAIPLLARDKAVAVLYADSAAQDSEAINLEALETLVRVAGMSVELLATKRPTPAAPAPAAPRRAQESQSAATPATSTDEASTSDAPGAVAASSATSTKGNAATAHTVQTDEAEGSADAPSSTPSNAPPSASSSAATSLSESAPSDRESHTSSAATFDEDATSVGTNSLPASSGARADDDASVSGASSETAQASQPTSSTPVATPLATSRRYGQNAELPVEVPEEEKRFHNDARRFARLLVSEIKLYNEAKVSEGRTHGDLYSRLREDIDRSRQMYDKRVAPEVAGRYDYFHHELVNTLAQGDPSKLGDGYPGATVSA